VNYVFKSFATGETEFPVDDTIISHPLSIGFFSTRLRTLKTDWPNAMEHPLYYIGIYAAIGMATAAINVAGYVVQFTGALKASRVLFERLLRSVARATMRWYDVTPQGWPRPLLLNVQ
jgi:ABC-type multidrug transport system fused ATPase/permease subunit